MSGWLRVAALCMALVAAVPVGADGTSAAAAFFGNLEKAGIRLDDVSPASTVATPTLVKHIYRLNTGTAAGAFIGYINEAGTLTGDAQGFRLIVPNAQPRALSYDETAQLRAEIVRNIDVDQLIPVRYGDGGGRRLVMFSAVDCPYCAKFEASMAKLASQANSTLYVVPSALRPTSYGGQATANWQIVAKLWCAQDPTGAWLAFWARRAVPAGNDCGGPVAVEQRENELGEILDAVGVKRHGTPAVLSENGSVFTPKAPLDAAYVRDTLGPAGKPYDDGRAVVWLGPPAAAAKKPDGPGSLLKKLFQK